MKYLLAFFLVLFSVPVFGQTANVFFYRVREVNGLDNRDMRIYLDEKEIFVTKQSSWIAMKIPVGKYSLRSKQKRSEILLKVEADKNYFLRLSKTPEGFFLAEKIEMITDVEQASFQMRDLKFLDKKRIKTTFELITELPK